MPVTARALVAWRWLIDPTTVGLPLLLTLALRIFYSTVAAGFSAVLEPDTALIRSNALTDQLLQRSDGLRYALLGVWQRFDTLWYLQIADAGYARPSSVVFFPLYPLLIRALSALGLPPLVAALAISTLAMFFMLWGLQKLLLLDQSPEQVRRALLVAALWPASFIFFAGYAESLVIAFVVWSIYAARQQRWWWCGALGLLAGLTKAVGAIAVVPVALLAVRERNWRAAPLLLALAGPLGFFGFLVASDRALPTAAYERYWNATVAWPWATAWASLVRAAEQPDPDVVLNLVLFAIAFALALLVKQRREYLLYALAVLAFVLTKRDAAAQLWCRYALVAFPLYANLSRLPMSRPLFGALITLMAALNVVALKAFQLWSMVV